ncbi:MAG: hypothetical protein QGD94_09770, partial [Planctomycetia bacterium]|nr:hypothetical protein [Planctomycetia bacterium]
MTKSKTGLEIALDNGTKIEMPIAGGQLLGIGRACAGDLVLRNPELPIFPFIVTFDGITYSRATYEGFTEADGKVIIHSKIHGTILSYQEQRDHYQYQVFNPGPWGADVEDELDWIFSESSATFPAGTGDGRQYTGFAYSFRYRSKEKKIHRLVDRATWELGGRCEGNHVLFQCWFTAPDFEPAVESSYSSNAYIADPEYKGSRYMMQFLCRFGHMQTFDYHYNDDAIMVQFFDKPFMLKSLIQTDEGEDYVKYFEQHLFPLSGDVTTVPKNVVVSKLQEPLSYVGQWNEWTRVSDTLNEGYLAYYDFKQDEPMPTLCVNYWNDFKITDYLGDPFEICKKMDAKYLFVDSLWITAASEHGGNMCAPYEFDIADAWGGYDALKEVVEEADKEGIEIFVWFATHLSTASPLLGAKGGADWGVRLEDSRVGGPFPSLLSANLHSGFRAYMIERMKYLKERTGLHGFMYDSYAHLGQMALTYASDDIAPQFDECITMQQEIQKMGYKWMVESLGPYGLCLINMGYLEPKGEANIFTANSINTFIGREYIGYRLTMGTQVYRAIAEKVITPEVYYRMVANKYMLCMSLPTREKDGTLRGKFFDDSITDEELKKQILELFNDEFVRSNRDYNQAIEHMHKRTILEDYKGVSWES